MNRPGKYHISDPVLSWVYDAKEVEAYFVYLEERIKTEKRFADNMQSDGVSLQKEIQSLKGLLAEQEEKKLW